MPDYSISDLEALLGTARAAADDIQPLDKATVVALIERLITCERDIIRRESDAILAAGREQVQHYKGDGGAPSWRG